MARNRNVQIIFWVSENEKSMIEEKMAQAGMTNLSAYLRRIAIDGMIVRLELPELKDMAEIAVLKTHIINYAKTRDIYTAYRKAGYSKKYYDAHESDIIIHKAAKKAFDELALKKLPTVKSLQAEYSDLLVQKKLDYAALAKAREEARQLQIYKANAEMLLRTDADEQRQTREHQQEK